MKVSQVLIIVVLFILLLYCCSCSHNACYYKVKQAKGQIKKGTFYK